MVLPPKKKNEVWFCHHAHTLDVEITTCGRIIAFVLVVGTRDTHRLTEKVERDGNTRVRATDRPSGKISVDSSAEDSQERAEISSHAEH